MSKTNSNSITSILIYALNNKKSGFRAAMLDRFNLIENSEKQKLEIPKDIVFYDGTHSPLDLKGMQGAEIDIYGQIENEIKIMIEVKANLNEDLQKTQEKGGAYSIVARNKGIPLVYVIPNEYDHEDKLPVSEPSKGKKKELVVEKIYWTEIRDIARKYDSTGLEYQIENFVQIIDTEGEDILLNKNETALLISQELSPKLIEETYTKTYELLDCIDNCLGKNEKSDPHNNQYGIGYCYNNNNYWIGLLPFINPNDEKYFLSFGVCVNSDDSEVKNKITKIKEGNNAYFDGEYYYVPYDSSDAEKLFETISQKFKNQIQKEKDLKEWLKQPCKRIREIKAVYGLSDKIYALIENYLDLNNRESAGKQKHLKTGTGLYYSGKMHFIGLDPSIKSGNIKDLFSIIIKKSKINNEQANKDKIYKEKKDIDGEWYYFPIQTEKTKDLFNDFLLSETAEEQQKNFNKLMDKAIKNTEKYLLS